MSYRLLVFDWDGTLMNSEARIVDCMRRAAAEAELPVPEVYAARDIIGLGMQEAARRLFPDAGVTALSRLVERYRAHWLGEDSIPEVLFDGVPDVIGQLAADDYLLGVATGKSRRGLEHALTESELGTHFHATRCADETFSKPHPQMLEELMTVLGAAPDDTLMIGDTEYDMQMAANAGVDRLGVAYGVHSCDRLRRHGALACLTDIRELPGWLATTT